MRLQNIKYSTPSQFWSESIIIWMEWCNHNVEKMEPSSPQENAGMLDIFNYTKISSFPGCLIVSSVARPQSAESADRRWPNRFSRAVSSRREAGLRSRYLPGGCCSSLCRGGGGGGKVKLDDLPSFTVSSCHFLWYVVLLIYTSPYLLVSI